MELNQSQKNLIASLQRNPGWTALIEFADSYLETLQRRALTSDDPAREVFRSQGAREMLDGLKEAVETANQPSR